MPEILTIGHSTHAIERFLQLLRSGGVQALADVRRFPGSRRHPQFNAGALAEQLRDAGIEYVALCEELGGRRRAAARRSSRDSRHGSDRSVSAFGGRNASFAAYAEHMESEEFAAGLAQLEELGGRRRTAFMCAEADWRRCHRQLIAAALVARGWRVLHLLPDGRREEHPRLGS